jgi:hypothetical protein
MAHFKVMANGTCYGRVPIRNGEAAARAEAEKIVAMHKESLSGARKPTGASLMTLSIERDDRDYPLTELRNAAS